MQHFSSPILPSISSAFAIELDASDVTVLNLLLTPPGSRADPAVLWTRRFDTVDDRDAVLQSFTSTKYDLTFLGRLTMIFGSVELDKITTGIVTDKKDARHAAAKKAADKARDHQMVELFTRDTKRGYVLELQRKSRDEADWKVVYDRAFERDRLCDWARWQKPRFLEFLNHAAKHGNEALTRFLTDAMFETERRIKKEGRGAGGTRPLRMWRGD